MQNTSYSWQSSYSHVHNVVDYFPSYEEWVFRIIPCWDCQQTQEPVYGLLANPTVWWTTSHLMKSGI